MTANVSFDFADLSPRERYKLLIGTVVPRPIALVTTVDAKGVANAAPFSFFNCLSADPAILALGVENHSDLSHKDTARNIRATGVFAVHIVDEAMMDAMNVTAVPFPSHVDELAAAGLTALPCRHIAAPRIAEAPVAFECKLHVTLGIGASREIVLGEVLAIHMRPDIVNERLHVDPYRLGAIGRMGGHGYSRSTDYFELPTMSLAEFAATREGVA